MGLIGEHDYAVENMDTSDGARRLLIKNPWCDGPSIRTRGWFTPQSPNSAEPLPPSSAKDKLSHQGRQSSRLWVAIEDVAQHFESMYLNWNPALFSHREDRHFSWEIPSKVHQASLVKNPQYAVSSPQNGTIWILISRHFVDAELDIARGRRGPLAAVAGQLGYMSILIFENAGHRVQISGGESYRGPYVDSPQTLARFQARGNERLTIAVDQQELPLPRYAFTMSLFSCCPLQVTEASEAMSQITEQHGAWTRRTAGGNPSCFTYYQNPQYSLCVLHATPASILLSTDVDDIHVRIDVVWARGHRVTTVRQRDLVASSGEYRRSCAVADIGILEPGNYTLVCSTFDAGQLANFVLRIGSMYSINVTSVATEAAGRLSTKIPRLLVSQGDGRHRLAVTASWLTRASVAMSSRAGSSHQSRRFHTSSSSMVRISVVHGWGPEQVSVAVSGNDGFMDPSMSVRTPQFDIEPERVRKQGLWVIVESMGSHDASLLMEGEIQSDSPVRVGIWESV